jgi:uncharacterized protein
VRLRTGERLVKMERPELAGDVLACEQVGDRIAHKIFSRVAERGAVELDPPTSTRSREAADRLGLYGVEAPMEQAQQMSEVLVDTADLFAASLVGVRDGDDTRPELAEIHRREDAADRIVRAAVASLFAIASERPPGRSAFRRDRSWRRRP